ncbi:MAG: histone deacetylase [Planctomycetaceae bacterium]|nr:histone deacetylase [Planctomycetaceae bacterium]
MRLFSDERFLLHDTGSHPECAARLVAINEELRTIGTWDQCAHGTPRAATVEELTRVHPVGHRKHVEAVAQRGGGRLDADTVCSPRSAEIARLAAGTACAAVDAVLSGDDLHALALVRPPGHHALAQQAMGFCLYNNIAIAARHAQQTHGVERVLIVDWDVHHGNGTQAIFYDDPSVHFLSIHRHPFYPGTGQKGETGTGPGLGATWNVPIAYGTSRIDYFARFEQALAEAATACQPECILVSAGFDAHRLDPIGSLDLETEDFSQLTRLVQDVANVHCGGRFASLLEGGYNTSALAESVRLHIEALLAAESAADAVT